MQLGRPANNRRRCGVATRPPAWYPPGEHLCLRSGDSTVGNKRVGGAAERVGAAARRRQHDLHTGRPPRREEHQGHTGDGRITRRPIARVGRMLKLVGRRKVVVSGRFQIQRGHETAEREAETLGRVARG